MRQSISLLLIIICLISSRDLYSQNNTTISLFNGQNLNGWDTYLGPPLDDSGKKLSETPIGLNSDPNNVFSIVEKDGENVIRISGEKWGGISTTSQYDDFHLQLQYRWGKLTWGQKKNKNRDSGLLYFATGEHGADYGAWMRSQEFQIEEGNTGDYWGVAGAMQDIPVSKNSKGDYVYDPAGDVYTFSAANIVGRHCVKRGDAEHPSGEWNMIDLYCHGDTSIHVVNGRVMMVLFHSAQMENGQAIPLVKGKIQIQSEGAEVFYRNITIERLGSIPENLLN
ncbi:MAG: DUF1080 domain-containing protein [Ginsengibacter sp.]